MFRSTYDLLVEKIPVIGMWSFQQVTDAMLLVGSRSFGVKVNGTFTNVMVPLADMLNHNRPPDAIWTYDDSIQGFKMTAARNIKKGQEIFDSYGEKSSYEFLLDYGFIYENE